MKASQGITTATLENIAADMGIRIVGDSDSFVLRPISGSDTWRKIGRNDRRVNAISWQGHYVFLSRVFHVWPNGRIRSCIADYQGLGSFLALAPKTQGQGFG